MGKRKRRLHSPKYAKKYASVRETYRRLRGVIKEAEADGVVTEQEVQQIEEAKQEVVEALASAAVDVAHKAEEEIKNVVEKVVAPVAEVVEKVVAPVAEVAKKATKKAPAKRKTVKRPAHKPKSPKSEG